MAEFSTEVPEPIRYAGPDSDDPLTFRWYDADRVVGERTMAEHLRIAVCYWHSFNWPGNDVFGDGGLDRPWLDPTLDPMAAAAGIFGSVDANRGDDRLGWDTDQFPNSVDQMALGVYEILRAGGLTAGDC